MVASGTVTATGQAKVTCSRRFLASGGCAGGGGSGTGKRTAAGGRPRRGGVATATSGGEWQAFSLNVETTSSLLPT